MRSAKMCLPYTVGTHKMPLLFPLAIEKRTFLFYHKIFLLARGYEH